jgi:glutaredoxin 2
VWILRRKIRRRRKDGVIQTYWIKPKRKNMGNFPGLSKDEQNRLDQIQASLDETNEYIRKRRKNSLLFENEK